MTLIEHRERWLANHLVVIPSLLEHMRGSVVPLAASGTSERVGGSQEPPAPLNLRAADDADRLWSHLCHFVGLVATRIGEESPLVIDGRTLRHRSPADVALAAGMLVRWLNRAKYRIATDAFFERYFTSEENLFLEVERARRLHPVEMKQLPARFRCKVCGEFGIRVEYETNGDPAGFTCMECGHAEKVR